MNRLNYFFIQFHLHSFYRLLDLLLEVVCENPSINSLITQDLEVMAVATLNLLLLQVNRIFSY